MSLSHTLRTYNVGQLLKDATFRRKICELSKQCTGGGDSSTQGLQQVTDNSNITSNALLITGNNNTQVADGILIIYNPDTGIGQIASISEDSTTISLLSLSEDGFSIGNNSGISLDGNDENTTPFRFLNNGVLERASGANGTQPNDFITLQQAQSMGTTNPNVVTSSNGVSVLPSTYYTYNGGSAPTWILPPVSSGIGSRIGILNDSAFDITLNSNAGANDIVDSGSKTNTATIVAGSAKIIYNNSINWFFIT